MGNVQATAGPHWASAPHQTLVTSRGSVMKARQKLARLRRMPRWRGRVACSWHTSAVEPPASPLVTASVVRPASSAGYERRRYARASGRASPQARPRLDRRAGVVSSRRSVPRVARPSVRRTSAGDASRSAAARAGHECDSRR
jgi:hypothetical protein